MPQGLTALSCRIDGHHSAGGAFEDRVGVLERSDPAMLAGFIDEVARGPNLRTHRSLGKLNARKIARRRMPEGPGHVSAPIQKVGGVALEVHTIEILGAALGAVEPTTWSIASRHTVRSWGCTPERDQAPKLIPANLNLL